MRFASVLAAFSVASTALVFACAKDAEVEPGDRDDAGAEAGRPDSSTVRSDAGGTKDSGKQDGACEGELETYNECELDGMQCGPSGYVAWCHQNEAATDSAQRIAARAKCLGTAYCEPKDRSDCIYAQYNDTEPTAAQAALLGHYCAACEPEGVEGCKARTLHYAPGHPEATDTIFLATWELSAGLVDAIDANCIAPLAGVDAGTCAEAFDDCAGGYYIDALVADCPG